MCSFLIYNFDLPESILQKANALLKLRGPDLTSIRKHQNYTFVHNLLSITGGKTPQPFIEGNVIALYNGEIYNYKEFGDNYQSDGQCLIPLYHKYGPDFVNRLDGEFAICLFDFNRNILVMGSDVFRTKPLFFATTEEKKIGIASYASSLKLLGFSKISPIPCNSIVIFDLTLWKQIEIKTVFPFDLRQEKRTYQDWFNAFERSIKKRTSDKCVVIPMSSGYDSGCIAAAMHQLGKNYHLISFCKGRENEQIIEKRHQLCPGTIDNIAWDTESKKHYTSLILELGRNDLNPIALSDPQAAIFATAYIMDTAKKHNYRVSLSGSGVDEIISDYWGGIQNGNFGGVFPNDLRTIFPNHPKDENCTWKNFYMGAQEKNLMREEFIGGLFGIENRYPFLDKEVVQEFLWLHPTLKNRIYKAPLHEYLIKNNYPFDKNKKIGLYP